MSTAIEAPAPANGKKKLLVVVAIAVGALMLAGGGAAAVLMMKKGAAAEQLDDDDIEAAEADPASRAAPLFVPLDSFTVNLADRHAERYAQVGITLEIDNARTADQIKAFMPAVRNNILMAIADRTAVELMDREGKVQLAERVRRETARALGYAVDTPAAPAAGEDAQAAAKPRRKRAAPAAELPVRAVHFSNFIIQ